MVVRLHPEALAEYAEAVGFYEERAPGLGREFYDEVERVLRLIEEKPGFEVLSMDPIGGRFAVGSRSESCIVRAVT